MDLLIPGKLICFDIQDAPFVHVARRNDPLGDQFPQPGAGMGIVVVVVVHALTSHGNFSLLLSSSTAPVSIETR